MEYPRPSSIPAALDHWLDHAPWPMHFLTRQGPPLSANPALAKTLGYRPEELDRHRLQQCIPSQTQRRLHEAMAQIPHHEPPPFIELPLLYHHRDGSELWAHRARLSLYSPADGLFLLMLADMTALDGLSLADLQARLCRLVTHDLNNAFTVAQSFVNLTRRQRPRPDQAQDYLARAAQALRRSIEISRHLAMITVDHPLPYERCCPAEAIAPLRPIIPRLVSPGPQWTIHCEQDLPLVMSHPIYLQRLLLDLSINARLGWPHSSAMQLRIRRSRSDGDTILIRLSPSSTAAEASRRPFRLFFTRVDPLAQVIEDPLYVRGIIRHRRVPVDVADDGITAMINAR